MAFAKWKAGKRGRRKILIVRWRDIAAPRGWREERRPKDLTLTQAREYARDMERRADLVAKGFATEPGRTPSARSGIAGGRRTDLGAVATRSTPSGSPSRS